MKTNINNYERVRKYLFKSDCFLTTKIVEKVLVEYSKLNENFPIFDIIKLCKFRKIPVSILNLNLDPKVMKSLIMFIMDNTINFEESFYSILSDHNKSYLSRNFSIISNKKLNELDMNEECKSFSIKDEIEKSESLAESNIINDSKSYVKVDKNNNSQQNNQSNDFVII